MATSKSLLFNMDLSPMERMIATKESYIEHNLTDAEGTFEVSFMRDHFNPISATTDPPIFTCSMTIAPDLCSRRGLLHGAAATLIFDMCTSFALACVAREGFWEFSGVSQKLEVTYMRPVPAGTEVLCISEVISAGKSMSFITGKLVRKSDGVVLCTCMHNKSSIQIGGTPKATL